MRPRPPRDQERSDFTTILEDCIARLPGVLGAVLVDRDGETVDYAGALAPFCSKVAAAYMQIVRGEVAGQMPGSYGPISLIAIRAASRSFAVVPLEDGYSLVLIMSRRAFALSDRALRKTALALAKEALWSLPERPTAWHPVEVRVASFDRRRPVLLKAGPRWERVEVLGAVVGLRHEHGYRVRAASGAELTVVREPSGHWYADDLISNEKPPERT